VLILKENHFFKSDMYFTVIPDKKNVKIIVYFNYIIKKSIAEGIFMYIYKVRVKKSYLRLKIMK
jgi:hypothetical protein